MGDYGKVDKQTGEFNREGNIYDDMHIYEDTDIAVLVKDHPPKPAAREEVYIAASREVKRSDLNFGASMLVGLRNLSQDRTYVHSVESQDSPKHRSKANGPLVLSVERY